MENYRKKTKIVLFYLSDVEYPWVDQEEYV